MKTWPLLPIALCLGLSSCAARVELYCPEPPQELVQKHPGDFRQRLEEKLDAILGPTSPARPTGPTDARPNSTD